MQSRSVGEWFAAAMRRMVSPSTRAFLGVRAGEPRVGLFDRLHGYVYGRWAYLYIAIGTGEHPIGRLVRPLGWLIGHTLGRLKARRVRGPTFADTYHGKAVPLAAARRLVQVREPLTLSLPESVLPYAVARDIVLRDPDHLAVLDCPCRVARKHPCLPLDVCLIVGEPFVSFVVEHHPQRARRISSDEAVDILAAEDARGHAHHAFFKDAMLGRYCTMLP